MNSFAPVVIFGARDLGRRLAHAIRPQKFCDNNPALQGTAWEGIPIESPEAAAHRFPNATFVIAIWHPSRTERMWARIPQRRSLGGSDVIPFSILLAEHRDVLLPNMFWERPDYYVEHDEEINRARVLMDPEGREEFERQIRLRLGDTLDQVIDPGPQYFPSVIFLLVPDEVFVDYDGAYDGDTVAEFRWATSNQFVEFVAFEPDPQNFAALKSAANGDPRTKLHPYAPGRRHETVHFALSGTGSRVSSSGNCEVQAITLACSAHCNCWKIVG